MEEQGCGYSLRVRCSDAHRCVELLRKGQVSFRKVYRMGNGGEMEELEL
jgi:hypothetical protein